MARRPPPDSGVMPASILVTGAAGFVGSHLLDLLTGSGLPDGADGLTPRQVVGWHRPGSQAPRADSTVRWEAVDVLDRPSVMKALARLRPAVVYHCAGSAHVGRAWTQAETAFAVNVRGTHHLLDGLSIAGSASRVLVPGSALVYRPADEPLTEDHPLVPNSPYGLSKLAQEMLGRHEQEAGVRVMIARAFNHVGPRQDPAFSTSGFARQIAEIEAGLAPPEILVGNLDARRDLTDVRDTVRAYQLIAEQGVPGRSYNVCSGRALVIGDVLTQLIARARVPIRIRIDPARFRPNDVPLLVGSSMRLRQELGWAPLIPLEDTLTDILEYWRREVARGYD